MPLISFHKCDYSRLMEPAIGRCLAVTDQSGAVFTDSDTGSGCLQLEQRGTACDPPVHKKKLLCGHCSCLDCYIVISIFLNACFYTVCVCILFLKW